MTIQKFYAKYPEMQPYVGRRYNFAKKHNCGLLVIGESHYLPEDSKIHKNCSKWYEGDSSCLTEEEQEWISTKDIIAGGIDEHFPTKAHGIYRIGVKKINKLGPKFEDYRKCFDYIVFYNYFLRPANQGNSMKELVEELDVNIANNYFKQMVKKYSPSGVVFLSTYAYDSCSAKDDLTIPIARAPHPSCMWWNRRSKKFGNRYGRNVVRDGLKGINWDPIQ